MNKIRNVTSSKILNGFEDDLNNEDYSLFESVGDFMKGHLDIEDVHNDPAFAEMKISADSMIEDYFNNKIRNEENEKFIKDIFSGKESVDNKAIEEKTSIREEIKDNKLNEITAEWVKEWHERKQKSVVTSGKSKEITDFVTGALNHMENHEELPEITRKSLSKQTFFKYASLAAAALVGVFMIIKTLIPSSDTGKIFNSYYKPFDAMSAITRSMESSAADRYSSAIVSYKNGDYVKASAEFTAISDKDPGQESARFFIGLSQLALENYSRAIPLLSSISVKQGEYTKEARWYLGLAYLKISDEKKARECFEFLASSDGYYRERSEKILRRLK